jgi:hypothetical protein
MPRSGTAESALRWERRRLAEGRDAANPDSGLRAGASRPEQRGPKGNERSSEDVVEMDSVSTRKRRDNDVPTVRTEPHGCGADDDRRQSNEFAHAGVVLHEPLAHPPLVLRHRFVRPAMAVRTPGGVQSDWTGDRSRWCCALQTDSGPTYDALDPAAPPGTAPVTQWSILGPTNRCVLRAH